MAMTMAWATVALQWMILRSFLIHTDVRLFSTSCTDGGEPICEPWELNQGTIALVFIILLGWTLADMMTGCHFVIAAFQFRNPTLKRVQLLLAGMVAVSLGSGTLFSAFLHIMDDSTSDLEALLNVVGILYVMEFDDTIFKALRRLAPHWYRRMMDDISREFPSGLNGTSKMANGDGTGEGRGQGSSHDQGHATGEPRNGPDEPQRQQPPEEKEDGSATGHTSVMTSDPIISWQTRHQHPNGPQIVFIPENSPRSRQERDEQTMQQGPEQPFAKRTPTATKNKITNDGATNGTKTAMRPTKMVDSSGPSLATGGITNKRDNVATPTNSPRPSKKRNENMGRVQNASPKQTSLNQEDIEMPFPPSNSQVSGQLPPVPRSPQSQPEIRTRSPANPNRTFGHAPVPLDPYVDNAPVKNSPGFSRRQEPVAAGGTRKQEQPLLSESKPNRNKSPGPIRKKEATSRRRVETQQVSRGSDRDPVVVESPVSTKRSPTRTPTKENYPNTLPQGQLNLSPDTTTGSSLPYVPY